MKIGLIGLPNSGKTTIFNGLTRSEAPVTAYANAGVAPNLAVVDVVDDRVDRLSEIYNPRKVTYAAIEFIDFSGLTGGAAREGLFDNQSMGSIRNTDALALVVRNYPDDLTGPAAPLEDLKKVEEELLISDMIIVEKRLERIEYAYQRGKRNHALETEEKLLRGILDQLTGNGAVRALELDGEQEKAIRGFQFLTQKPLMIILNSTETNFGKNQDLCERIQKTYRVVEFAGQFEMELSRLTDSEAVELFMEDMGLKESARDRLTRLAYDILGYISFFTVGDDEVRAWSIQRGNTALHAADTIHTDLARGFIRAECFSYDDLMACGTEKRIREMGKIRLEGKNYIVGDGNILNIRFNV